MPGPDLNHLRQPMASLLRRRMSEFVGAIMKGFLIYQLLEESRKDGLTASIQNFLETTAGENLPLVPLHSDSVHFDVDRYFAYIGNGGYQ